MRDLNENPIIVDDIKNEYSCISDLLIDYDLAENPDLVSISCEDLYKPITDTMPFYFDSEKFVYDMAYMYLPFSEYEEYGIKDAKIVQSFGRGGDNVDLVQKLIELYEAINKLALEQPVAYGVLSYIFTSAFINALKFLKSIFNSNYSIKKLLKFAKEKRVQLNVKKLSSESFSKDDENKINEGLKMLQELENSNLLDKLLEKYNEIQRQNYEESQKNIEENNKIDEKG